MSQKYLVCQGATCKCNFGTTPDKLKVLTQNRHYINDKDGKEKLTSSNWIITAMPLSDKQMVGDGSLTLNNVGLKCRNTTPAKCGMNNEWQ